MMINAVILASGFSRRMGKNKLLEKIGPKYLIQYIIETVLESAVDNVVVVYRDKELENVLKQYNRIQMIFNKNAANGQSEAIKKAINGMNGVGNYLFFVGDQPLISVDTINMIINEYDQNESEIVAAMYNGKRGNPVLFSNNMVPELLKLEGDEGGRQVLRNNEHKIAYVNISDLKESFDVDCPKDLEHMKSLIGY